MKNITVKLFALLAACAFFYSCDEDEPDTPPVVNQTVTISEHITQPTQWIAGNTYLINGTIDVSSTLIIQPGTIVKFSQGSYLSVARENYTYGTITALGTAEKPIIFTSSNPTPTHGDYGGITFYDGAQNCKFEFCTFQYGGTDEGYGMIYILETDVWFKNCTFKNSKYEAIALDHEGLFSAFENNTISDNGTHPITVLPENVHTIGLGNVISAAPGKGILIKDYEEFIKSGSFTWHAQTVPYYVMGDLHLGSSSLTQLTIEAGAVLCFYQNGAISVGYEDSEYGKLIVNGTSEKHVIFTTANPNPQKGDWYGLGFYTNSSGSTLNYCEILYAGYNEDYGAFSLYDINANSVTLSNSRIGYSASHAIVADEEGMIDYSTVSFDNNVGEDYHVR